MIKAYAFNKYKRYDSTTEDSYFRKQKQKENHSTIILATLEIVVQSSPEKPILPGGILIYLAWARQFLNEPVDIKGHNLLYHYT